MSAESDSESSARSSPPLEELSSLAHGLSAHLRRAALLGAQRVPRAAPSERPVLAAGTRPPTSHPTPHPASASLFGELAPLPPPESHEALPDLPLARENQARAAACTSLGELRTLVAECVACALCRTRTQTVFSDGSEHARVMFIGEAPGESEDRQGVPFVGAAGQLLTDIIQKGMGLPRQEVHIANVLKCRPPENREPAPDEKALCTPYLDRQIELVDPEVLIALGLHAARHLLHTTLSMGRLRGKVHLWNGRKVIATYHPAFLLRNPGAKKDCWQDIQLAMRELGLRPPGAARPAPPA